MRSSSTKVHTKYLWESWGRTIQFFWAVLAPSIKEGRVVENQSEGNGGFEKLNVLMRGMDRLNTVSHSLSRTRSSFGTAWTR